jgi:hypothetical protein
VDIIENAKRFQVKLRLCRSEARSAREARLRRNDVAPSSQMMYGFAVMMLPSANDVGLRPMMLRLWRK